MIAIVLLLREKLVMNLPENVTKSSFLNKKAEKRLLKTKYFVNSNLLKFEIRLSSFMTILHNSSGSKLSLIQSLVLKNWNKVTKMPSF